jgi:amino acid adenylation domain-containing protein
VNNVAVEDIYPLAPTQEGILFHTINDGGAGFYFVQSCIVLQGRLELDAFRRAWEALVERHPVLRTSFHWEQLDRPLQVVQHEIQLPLEVLDWRHVPLEQHEEQLALFLEQDRQRGLDPNSAPLFRITLIDLGEASFQFIWSLNHIIIDGWSISLLYQELFTMYQAFLDDAQSSLDRVVPYKRYISWLQKQDLGAAKRFWRSLLDGFTTPSPLLIEQPDHAGSRRHEIAVQSRQCGPDLADALQKFARRERLTMSTLLHAAWGLVLCAYSGENDVVFGSVSSGRSSTLPEAERIVGLLLVTLPIRLSCDSSRSLSAWLSDIQQQLVELRQFDFSSLVQVQGWSDVPRDQPLFESILVFENYPLDDFLQGKLETLRATDVKFITPTNYPLTVQVMFAPQLTFSISYDTSRFAPETVERVFDHLVEALRGIAGCTPTMSLRELNLLSQAERELLLSTFNETVMLPDLERGVGDYLAEHSAARPDAIAVRYGDRTLTYKALAARANQMTRWLLLRDLPPGSRIGVFAERDIEMLIMLIACLQSGYTYVPLDPVYPDIRLSQILDDSGCMVIATTQDLAGRVKELVREQMQQPTFLIWDIPTPQVDALPTAPVVSAMRPHQVATIFYTSGSTGKPKGVMVEYIGLLNHLWAKIEVLEIGQESCVAQTAAHSFDISIWQFLAALLVGGEVIIYPLELVLMPLRLFRQMQEDRVTIVETVPTLLEAFLSELEHTSDHDLHLSNLKYLISNAETLPVQLTQRWFAAFPDVPLLNTYGATECSDDTTHIVIREPLSERTLRVPVGTPIAGFQIYVVDEQLLPVPVGCVGQIAMAGIGVGQGYLNDPYKTAAIFVPNPFGGPPGNRLYLTGDRGRWREDGQLDFLGRTDGQVKVRGHRIELGEVEAALNRCPGVRHAVAVARSNGRKQLRLAGYVVAAEGIETQQVRESLAGILPHYMVPDHIVMLAEMPLNTNGKVDRDALPAPDDSDVTSLELPRTPLEELVAGVWCQVLNVPTVARHDNFFEHGGHSLLATQVITRLRQAVGVELPLRSLFEHPTVAGLGAYITAMRQKQPVEPMPPLHPASRQQPPPLSYTQQRLWIIDQLVSDNPVYTMPVILRLNGTLNREALSLALDGLIARHESLRTYVDVIDGRPVQMIEPPAACGLEQLDLRECSAVEQEARAESAIRKFVTQPFALSRGPLFRVQIVQLADDDYLLVLVLHHIVTDGWSTSILVRDLMALYEAAIMEEDALQPLSIQYADFAVWQRSWLKDEILERQVEYWRQQLHNAPALLNLPTDRPRPAVQSFQGATLEGTFSAELVNGLRALSRDEGTTLFMTLLASYQALLAAYSGQQDIVVGTPIAGRPHPELEELIGFFVNTLVMRTTFESHFTVSDLLAHVREVTLDAYAHQDVPFDYLVEVLQTNRTLSYTPIFQVAFALQNTPETHVQLSDLAVNILEQGDLGVSRFDLMLSLREEEDGTLSFAAEYSTDLFEETTIRRMLQHYQRLLAAMVEDPQQKVTEINLLSLAERETILHTWNETSQLYRPVPVYTLVAEQATRTPQAIAICVGDDQLTYRELIDEIYQLAHLLKTQGIGRGDRVGIFMQRQLPLIPALLAVQAAGAAYVPLDPAYPNARLSFMIEDADLRLVITETNLLENLPAVVPVLDRNAVQEQVAKLPATAPDEHPSLNDLAYIIYTSGSTGRPKGVAITHRGFSAFIAWAHGSFAEEAKGGVLASTSICFDLSVFEMYLPLVSGGAVILVENGLHMPSSQHKLPVTLIGMVPSVVADVLDRGELPATARSICLGGEAVPEQLVNRLYKEESVQHVYDVYGPTEDTVYSTWHRLEADSIIVIGRPIWNSQAYILDESMHPVPIGVVGELYLGGDGLAWGYLKRPLITAERFVPNPFSKSPGARLYRTGDLARLKPEGVIEYLGRSDHQVQIRGFRVELDEIKKVLLDYPGLQQAVVGCYQNEEIGMDNRLVAYVVSQPDQTLDVSTLRAHLGQHLPDYMIPTAFVEMDKLPLTLNGKVDRKALPLPDDESLLRTPYIAPRTPTEELIAALWTELLQVERIGVTDNFFLLGGHSLLATQVLAQIQSRLGLEVPLRVFFEEPSVAALADYIDAIEVDLDEEQEMDELLDLVENLSDEEVVELLAHRSHA